MRETDVREKVEIFISSNINSKYTLVRESLRLLLLQTGLCEIYTFEEEPASSTDVVSAYLYRIDRADLVIFLIDNQDGIGQGTLKEIRRSRDLNKKCLFLFCNESKKDKTELQIEIMQSQNGEKYKEVSKLSHMAEEAYKSVLADLIDIYLRYCRNSLTLTSNTIDNNDENMDIELSNTQYILGKEVYANHDYFESVINSFIFSNRKLPNAPSIFEKVSGDLLKVVLGIGKLEDVEFELLKKEIKELHEGNLKKTIMLRIEAMELYFKGDLDEATNRLLEALKIAQRTQKIPTWIVNDIAIDLRNIATIINQKNNVIKFESLGQKVLNESNESVFFPIVDRKSGCFYEAICKKELSEVTQSPFTVNLGGRLQGLEYIGEIYVAALVYGSITHIIFLRDKLSVFLQQLSINTREHRFFCATIKILLVLGSKDNLEKFLHAYGEYTDSINEEDINEWIGIVNHIGIYHKRLNSRILLLSCFGYYFADEQFNDYYEELKAEILIWSRELYAEDLISKGYLAALENNQKRINSIDIINTAYLFFKKNLKRWYDDVFEILEWIDLKDISEEKKNKYVDWLILCANNEEIANSCHRLPIVLQRTRMQSEKDDKIDNVVKNVFPIFYEDTYSLNVFQHDTDDIYKYVNKQIDEIIFRNQNQGKGGYSEYFTNPYETISNIIQAKIPALDDELIDKMMKAISDTLFSETQTTHAKIYAIRLIVILKIYYFDNKSISEVVDYIIRKYKEYPVGNDVFFQKGYSTNVLDFYYNSLKMVCKKLSSLDMVELFSKLPDCETADLIIILNGLNLILNSVEAKRQSFDYKEYLLQFLFEMTRNVNKTVRCLAYICLISLVKVEKSYSDIVLQNVSQAMDNENYDIKLAIIRRIDIFDSDDSKVQYIISKGKVDNHYLVRKIAQDKS